MARPPGRRHGPHGLCDPASPSCTRPRCRLIESSLGSVATKLNFFIHNLAQMKFTGSDARPTLSFAPRTHTIKTAGRIRDVFLCRHERVFNPSKGYVSGDSPRGRAEERSPSPSP